VHEPPELVEHLRALAERLERATLDQSDSCCANSA
jgi:hypothetical protein